MKSTLKFISIIIFAISIVCAFSGCGKSENSSSTSASSAAQKGYVLQSRELTVLDRFLNDELAAFLDGQETLLFEDGLLAVSAIDVVKEYEKNQVSADQKYYKKSLLVNGSIASINSGLGNEPYVALRGINSFMAPQVHFGKNNVEKIAALKKGQKLSFVCEGAGAIAGIPIFKKCTFADDYAAEKITAIKPKIQEFLSGTDIQSSAISQLIIGTIVVARELPESSTCFTNGSKCSAELQAVVGKDTAKQKMAVVSEELKLLGVKVPPKPSK